MTPELAAAEDLMRHGPFFIVMNAASGHHNADASQRAISDILRQAGRQHQFLLVKSPAELKTIAKEAVNLARQQAGIVVAAGGDGTISAVAQEVLGSGCPFGVLPQGTFNYFGRVHGISQDAEVATQALLRAHVERVQVGKVNNHLFLVNASLGLYPKLLEDREAFKQHYGRSRAVAFIAGLATLFSWRGQLRLHTQSAGHNATLRTATLFVGNNHLQLERVGIEKADADAVELGYLAAVVVKPIGTWALFGLLLWGLLGRLGNAENINTFSFRRMTVSSRGIRRVKVALDGEVQWMRTPLVFEVAAEHLLLMVPAPAESAEIA